MNVDMNAAQHFCKFLFVGNEEAKSMTLAEITADRYERISGEIEANWDKYGYGSFDDYSDRFSRSWWNFESILATNWAERFYSQSSVAIQEDAIDAKTTALTFTFADGSKLVATQIENEDGELKLTGQENKGQFGWATETVEGSPFTKAPGFDYLLERFKFAEEAARNAWLRARPEGS